MQHTSDRHASAWQPLIDPALGFAARSSVERVAEELVRELQTGSPTYDLSGGNAGYAVGLTYLSECLGRADLLDPARTAWESAVDALSRSDSIPALHGGFCGTAWAAAHLAGRLLDESDADAVHEE